MKLKTYIAENNTTQEELSKKLTAIKTGKTAYRQTIANLIKDKAFVKGDLIYREIAKEDDCIIENGVIYAPRYKVESE